MKPERLAVGVDIGGTRLKVGLVTERGEVLRHTVSPTPPRGTAPRLVEDAVVEAVTAILVPADDDQVCGVAAPGGAVAVGVAAAGFVDAASGRVVFAPHFSWRDEPLQERLEARLAGPVLVDNDVNAAAWAEHSIGAGQGEHNLLVVNLGTGIGGAHLIDGWLYRGSGGLAGEYGHMRVVPGGRPCECGNEGCWEQYVSGSVLRRAGADLVRLGGPEAEALTQACRGDADALEGEQVTQAAKAGDPASIALLAELGDWLGTGLADLTAALDPGAIVVGGGLSEAGDLLLAPAAEALAGQLPGRGHRPVPPVRAARLGARAGMIGAALLALHETPSRHAGP